MQRLPYIHSFTVTQNYVVVAAAPLTWDLVKVMVAEPIMQSIRWEPKEPTVIYVMRLDGTGSIRTFNAEAFFAFHHVNGFEAGTGTSASSLLHFDVVANDMASGQIPATGLTVANLLNVSARDRLIARAELRRYTLDLSASPAEEGAGFANYTTFPLLDMQTGRNSTIVELPTINPSRASKPHCFVYLWAPHLGGAPTFGAMGLIKKDVCNATAPVLAWKVANHFPAEAVFVPRPGGAEEDDGMLLTVVWDGDEEKTYLALIDPATMETHAALYCEGHAMSFGIHGRFFPRD